MHIPKRVKRIILLIVSVALCICFLPIPIFRIRTMYGKCYRHGENIKVQIQILELNYLLKENILYDLLNCPNLYGQYKNTLW